MTEIEVRPGVFLRGKIPYIGEPDEIQIDYYSQLDLTLVHTGVFDLFMFYLLRVDGMYEESTQWKRDRQFHWLL